MNIIRRYWLTKSKLYVIKSILFIININKRIFKLNKMKKILLIYFQNCLKKLLKLKKFLGKGISQQGLTKKQF